MRAGRGLHPCRASRHYLIIASDVADRRTGRVPAGQLPVMVSMLGYALNTCSNREPSTRNTVVSGPTKTSAQTSAFGQARRHTLNARERRTMSGTKNNPPGTLDEHLRLGAGFAAADRPRILEALSALAPHLSGWEHDQVDLEVSLKDIEGTDQKVTLQAWLAGRAHLVATSHERDLDHALAEVRRDLIRQIEDERSRREPRKRRKTRYRTT